MSKSSPETGSQPAETDDERGRMAREREAQKQRLFEPGEPERTLGEDSEPPEEGIDPELRSLIADLLSVDNDQHHAEEVLARGGMGSVERVYDRRLRRKAARKVMRTRLADASWARRAFIAEAQITAQLQHPNIVPVHGLGRLEDDRLYFTMKQVQGQTLRSMIKLLPPGPIPRKRLFELLQVVVKVCEALSLAHDRGVFHCDIKPSNIMVGDYGEAYLMDWGLARVLDHDHGGTLQTSVSYQHKPDSAFGTAGYMPPEQAQGMPNLVDARTDVFGVGAVLYTIITRRNPYAGRKLGAAIIAAAGGRYTPIESVIDDGSVPRELIRIVKKAMEVRQEDRFQSARELRDALNAFMHGDQNFEQRTYAPGDVIVAEGDPGQEAFIIASGKCEVRQGKGLRRRSLRTMGAGDVFGETAVLTEAKRTATVIATEETVVYVVDRESFNDALGAMSPWMSAFVRTLAQRFSERG